MKYTVRVSYENTYQKYECEAFETKGLLLRLYTKWCVNGFSAYLCGMTHIINLAKTTDVEFILNTPEEASDEEKVL